MKRRIAVAAVWTLLACSGGCSPAGETEPEVPVGTEVGLRGPPLEGTLTEGEFHSFASGGGVPRVLVFYRSAHCGLCRVQLESLQEHLPAYRQQGAEVLGLTLDDPQRTRGLAQELQLTFPLLSVSPGTFHTWNVIDPQYGLPLPATYILDGAGIIRFRHIGRNAADRTTDAAILAALGALGVDRVVSERVSD